MSGKNMSAASPSVGTPEPTPATAPASPQPGGRPGLGLRARVTHAPAASVVLATLALTGIVGVAHPNFLHPNQLLDILQASTYVGLIACGMSYLIAMREI